MTREADFLVAKISCSQTASEGGPYKEGRGARGLTRGLPTRAHVWKDRKVLEGGTFSRGGEGAGGPNREG